MDNTQTKIELIKNALEKNDYKIKETAEFLNIKHQTLRWFIKKNNIIFNNQRSINIPVEELYSAYLELQSLKKVAEKFNLKNKEGLRQLFKRNDYSINKKIIHTVNDSFFNEENEKSFYWAGFIAADGNISKTRPYLSIALSIKDKSHLEKFNNDIEYSGNIGEYLVKNSIRNEKWNDTFKCELKITSQKIKQDLQRFNIIPNKTKIYTFPDWLINHDLVNHFMRGYFDGDGSFFTNVSKNKTTKQLYFSLRGTIDFLKVYRIILQNNCNLQERIKDIRINNIGILEYGGNNILKNIGCFLYKDATIFLERKKELFDRACQIF